MRTSLHKCFTPKKIVISTPELEEKHTFVKKLWKFFLKSTLNPVMRKTSTVYYDVTNKDNEVIEQRKRPEAKIVGFGLKSSNSRVNS